MAQAQAQAFATNPVVQQLTALFADPKAMQLAQVMITTHAPPFRKSMPNMVIWRWCAADRHGLGAKHVRLWYGAGRKTRLGYRMQGCNRGLCMIVTPSRQILNQPDVQVVVKPNLSKKRNKRVVATVKDAAYLKRRAKNNACAKKCRYNSPRYIVKKW